MNYYASRVNVWPTIAIVLACSTLVACKPAPQSGQVDPCDAFSSEVEPIERATPIDIDELAYAPYEKADNPKLFKKWGAKGVAKIDKVRELAAIATSYNPECDQVYSSDVSDSAQPPSDIVVWVSCPNERRFYMTEKTVSRTKKSELREACEIGSAGAISICKDELQKRPGTIQSVHHVESATLASERGRWIVELFSSLIKNNGDVDLLHTRCIVGSEGAVLELTSKAQR